MPKRARLVHTDQGSHGSGRGSRSTRPARPAPARADNRARAHDDTSRWPDRTDLAAARSRRAAQTAARDFAVLDPLHAESQDLFGSRILGLLGVRGAEQPECSCQGGLGVVAQVLSLRRAQQHGERTRPGIEDLDRRARSRRASAPPRPRESCRGRSRTDAADAPTALRAARPRGSPRETLRWRLRRTSEPRPMTTVGSRSPPTWSSCTVMPKMGANSR